MSEAASIPKPPGTGSGSVPALFLGFDTSIYPGDAALRIWREQSPYCWVGYYLPSPCHRDASWKGTRPRLVAMGYGIAPVYVGRQAQGPGSRTPPTRTLGVTDGRDAVKKCSAEGFPPLSALYLDVEYMDAVPDTMKQYARAWCGQVLAGGYAPGIYCHVKNAVALREALAAGYPGGKPEPVFWVSGNTKAFSGDRRPADSGVPFARLWQGRLDVEERYGDQRLRIDVNVGDGPDPSAIQIPQ